MHAMLLIAALGCARGDAPATPVASEHAPQGPTIPLTFGEHVLQVEVADDDAERQRGLMHRDGLAPDHGMVFVYPDSRVRSFWMKDTKIPLDIAFADAGGRIVHVAQMQPLDLTTTPSLFPAMYAVEADQGWFEAHAVKVGQRIEGLPSASTQ